MTEASTLVEREPEFAGMPKFLSGFPTPGANVDRVDREAGVREAATIGYGSWKDATVVSMALRDWSKGEEERAQKAMLGQGIDLGSIYRIVAAAVVAAQVPSDA